ncbi:2-oxo acid dehydrogenase subunit E2 [Halomonas dongshanensis]|uniref:Dihydrolipoamide acetyltransferase component of pyruvate dehydrogenase complex n=1 Tax=Halomonas dongshanensis TaxID=2890835 RepID=A0ABT2EG25_9GAMM|nr:2-oxo acid dehydrogenase subunit E2 [Halomonas dongshanensis]MCS2610544.1 2-oxo acid dehydrogenase subunit E2 [Halomonas dongshanensis]
MSDFLLPDIGEGIVECEVVEWLVNEGDRIAEDQPIVEVMTDKALVEITAPEAGVVTRLYVAQGKVARVHAPLYAYRGEGEGEGESEEERQGEDNEQGKEPAKTKAPEKYESAALSDASANVSPKAPHKTPASPAVRRLVREHGLTLDDIDGSGRGGRVLKEDVLACLKEDDGTKSTQADVARTAGEAVAPRREPLKGMRAVMAKRMVTSVSTIPHFHYGEEIDVTALLALRERLKEEVAAKGERLTLMPFFMKALALAIDAYPLVNARLDAAAENILYSDGCHIGMAVDGKAGLIVPNVKHVEQRSLFELAQEIGRLTQAAREGRVDAKDMSGGTITISNIGALGGTYAAPIINAPEAAIVAIGKSQWLPRFDAEGAVVRRAIATVTWAGDHRFIDGGTIARFCNAWKGYLEAPDTLLLHLR